MQVLPIEKEVLAKAIQNTAHLMDCKVDGGISRGQWSAHCSTGKLQPKSVTKLKHVVPHNNVEGLPNRSIWHFPYELGGAK